MGGTTETLTLVRTDAGIAAAGEIDAATCGELTAAILAIDAGAIARLDMSQVTFIDSSCLRALIIQHQLRSAQGSRLEIVAPSRQVLRVLELAGLVDELYVVDG